MIKLGTFLKYTSILFILILLWVVLFISTSVLKSAENNNLSYIPDNARVVIQVDGDQLIKEGISSAILHSEDTELAELLESILDKKQSKKDQTYGVKYDSDIIFFTLADDDINYMGTLLNLQDPSKFKLNMPKELRKTQIVSVVNNVGLILERSNERNEAINEKELQRFADDLLNSDSHFLANNESEMVSSGASIRTWVCDNMDEVFIPTEKAFLELQLNERQIDIKGTTKVDKGVIGVKSSIALKPSNFHFTTRLFSQAFNDTMSSILGEELPSIVSLSVNYRSTDFIGDPTFFLVPDIDLIVQFKDDVDLIDIMRRNEDVNVVSSELIVYGSVKFNIHQIDQRSFYIGRNPYKKASTIKSNELVIAKGDVKNLLKFNGGGMVMKFIKLTAMYNTAEILSNRIDELDFHVASPKNGSSEVSGKVIFKENFYAINEFLKVGLRHQIIQ